MDTNYNPRFKPISIHPYLTIDKEVEKMKEKEQENLDADDDIIEVHEGMKLDDGKHTGTIDNVVHEKRGDNQQYDYLDIYINVIDSNNNEVTIKTGFPCYISDNSQLGKFLISAGMTFEPKDKIGISKIKEHVVGKEINFQTFTEDQFARVMNKTISF